MNGKEVSEVEAIRLLLEARRLAKDMQFGHVTFAIQTAIDIASLEVRQRVSNRKRIADFTTSSGSWIDSFNEFHFGESDKN